MLTVFPIVKSFGETHSFTSFSDTSITAEGKLAGGQEGWGERGWRGSGVEGRKGPGVERRKKVEFATKYKLPTPTLGREERAFPTPENTLPPTQ